MLRKVIAYLECSFQSPIRHQAGYKQVGHELAPSRVPQRRRDFNCEKEQRLKKDILKLNNYREKTQQVKLRTNKKNSLRYNMQQKNISLYLLTVFFMGSKVESVRARLTYFLVMRTKMITSISITCEDRKQYSHISQLGSRVESARARSSAVGRRIIQEASSTWNRLSRKIIIQLIAKSDHSEKEKLPTHCLISQEGDQFL